VAARDEASAEAFRELGATAVALGGNLKADLPPPRPLHEGWSALRAAWSGDPVLVIGNTVAGEEDLLLAAWKMAKAQSPGLRLILAPRQPRRFDAVARDFAAGGLAFRRASEPWPPESDWRGTDVLLLDTLGELPSVYAEGTLALVAGGWAASGGHNPLEPIRAGLPTAMGPGFSNFEDLVQPLMKDGCLELVEAGGLEAWILGGLEKMPLRSAGAKPLPEALSGALDRTWALIEPFLPPRG
jgi:3-deoxy-D-manno-octulosonic-acid transferase